MIRDLKRKKQALTQEECIQLLENNTSGVLAVLGDDDYPYAVPLSYVYRNGKIYFHGSRSGHKIDAIRKCSKASFCVIGKDDVIPEAYTTCYQSVIAFGSIRIMEDPDEMRRAITALAERYCPQDTPEKRSEEIEGSFQALCMLELNIEKMTGKQARKLAHK